MPWRIDKVATGYKLYNLSKKQYVNVVFKSRETAKAASRNYMRYRGEKDLKR